MKPAKGRRGSSKTTIRGASKDAEVARLTQEAFYGARIAEGWNAVEEARRQLVIALGDLASAGLIAPAVRMALDAVDALRWEVPGEAGGKRQARWAGWGSSSEFDVAFLAHVAPDGVPETIARTAMNLAHQKLTWCGVKVAARTRRSLSRTYAASERARARAGGPRAEARKAINAEIAHHETALAEALVAIEAMDRIRVARNLPLPVWTRPNIPAGFTDPWRMFESDRRWAHDRVAKQDDNALLFQRLESLLAERLRLLDLYETIRAAFDNPDNRSSKSRL